MNKRTLQILFSVAAVAVILAGMTYFGLGAKSDKAKADSSGVQGFTKLQKRLLSGFADNTLDTQQSRTKTNSNAIRYFPDHADDQCAGRIGSNTKVNQNCLNLSDPDLQGRAQAQNETSIAQDPNNPSHIVASYNDYRRGDGNCYGAYTLNGGANWNDTTIPMSFTRGTAFGSAPRQYWQAGGDTAVAWDTKGNVYFQCQVFQRGKTASPNPDLSSAVYVFRSTQNYGASWNFPARPVIESSDVTGTGLPPFEDKPLMTVDNHKGSPYQDRVYVTYTEFAANGTAFIYESYSSDYGEHFSKRVLVSTASSLCPNSVTTSGTCDANQFSQPFTGPDGALYVVWANFNNAVTAPDNRNQMLLAKSTDGGNTFSAPVKVSDYYDLPDCATYQGGQDLGRACVPEKGTKQNSVFRAANYPSGAVNPKNAKQVVVTFGSYINVHSNEKNGCIPTGFSPSGNNTYTGVKTPGACNNDILESVSNNAGTTFTGTTTDPRQLTSVTTTPGQATTDQWWQWISFTNTGKLAVSYYDRQYGNDETTGNMDISLSGSTSSITTFGVVRVSSSSMPLPTQFPDAQGNSVFFGDYTGLTAVTNTAYPLWMDTRDRDLFVCPNPANPGTILIPPAVCTGVSARGIPTNDQDAYTAAVNVP